MGKNGSLYKPLKCELIKVVDESPLIKTFVLVPEHEFSFETGQFIEVTVDGLGEAPFTPSSSPLKKDKLEITVMKTGYVTDHMHTMKPGDIMGIRGPFGRGYPLEKFYDKEVLILGGGCGFAPIRSLLYNLIAISDKLRNVTLYYGSKTPEDCIYKSYIQELRDTPKFEVIRTVDHADENWTECIGVVTVLLEDVEMDIKNSVAVVCGPPIMMQCSTVKLLEMGYPEHDIFLSMEKNMSCGLGKCGHCMMGEYLVCKDGPVFTYDEVKDQPNIWN